MRNTEISEDTQRFSEVVNQAIKLVSTTETSKL